MPRYVTAGIQVSSNNENVSVSAPIYNEQSGTTTVVITAVAEGSAVITATSEDGGFTATADVTVEADEVIVDEVFNVQVAADDGQLALTWSEPEGIKQVKLIISEDEGVTDPATDPIYAAAGTGSYTFTNLTNGMPYYIKISTIDLEDNESAGITVSGTPAAAAPTNPPTEPPVDVTPPSEVTDAKVTAGDRKLTLRWTDPTDSDLASIIIKGTGGTELEPITVSKGIKTYTISNLSNGTRYELLISTVDASGNESAGITVSVTPHKPSSPSNGNDGGSSEVPVETTAPQTEATVGSNGQVSVKPRLNDDGSVEVKLNNDILKRALQQSEDESLNITVEADAQVNDLSIELPLDNELINEMKGIDNIVISLGEVKVTISTTILLNQAAANKGSLTLSVVKADSSKLPSSTQSQLNGADIYDIELLLDGQPVGEISSTGDVEVELPYNLAANEHPSNIVIYYINDGGELELVMNGLYRVGTGTVVFKPAHLSKYTAVYRETRFTDVKQGWAKEAIDALAARGIVQGVGEGSFNPNGNVTRAEFITMLINAFQLSDEHATASFSDVNDGAWYSASIATAQKLGIVNGKPDGSFGVHDNISREDMAVMVYKAMMVKQLELATGEGAAAFDDQASIAAYAQQAVSAMQAEGIIKGMGNGKFAPKQHATRAQAAMIIYNLLSYL